MLIRFFRGLYDRFFGGFKALSSSSGTDVPAPVANLRAVESMRAMFGIPEPLSVRPGPNASGSEFIPPSQLDYPVARRPIGLDIPAPSGLRFLESNPIVIRNADGHTVAYVFGYDSQFDSGGGWLGCDYPVQTQSRAEALEMARKICAIGAALPEDVADAAARAYPGEDTPVPEVTPVDELVSSLKVMVEAFEFTYGTNGASITSNHPAAIYYGPYQKAKYYFSCGQIHRHELCGGLVWDKDNLLEVVAEDADSAQNLVIKYFGFKWANRYSNTDGRIVFFPGGVIPWESWAADYARWWDMIGLKEGDMAFRWSSSFDGGDEGWIGFVVNQTYLDLIKEDPKSYRVSIPDDFSHYNSPTTVVSAVIK